MLSQAIKDFPKQFAFQPKVENAQSLKPAQKFVVAGMGGSNHATDVLKAWKPEVDVIVHRDYGLPVLNDLDARLIIACSYSGNTEETIDAFDIAVKNKLSAAAIAKGGKLLERAKRCEAPRIVLPDTGIHPRSAAGFMFMALLKITGTEADLKEASRMAEILQPAAAEAHGRDIAQKLKGYVPIIYSSARNFAIANNWKIKINENTKIPAFMNVVPELNHNEMSGFSAQGAAPAVGQGSAPGGDMSAHRSLLEKFHFIFLRDSEDNPRVIKRLEILQKLYEDRAIPVEVVHVQGQSRLEKIFSSLLLVDWVSLALADLYGIDPEPVPMVEEFKKLIV